MKMARLLKVDGTVKELDMKVIDALKETFRGAIYSPDDEGYDSVRAVWNAMIDRRPGLILQCKGTADLLHAVHFAKREGLLISVRGAGHNIAGRSIADEMLLIDLSQMRHVQVDTLKKEAIVSAGATLADIDHETQAYGLALPVGINSTTGIAGLTLGGGFGWLSRMHGMTVDHLLSAEVVTVDGEHIVCDRENHSDLFWAIRGGGGNFGIVSSFTFSLCEVATKQLSGPMIFSLKEGKKILQRYRDFCKECPRELTLWAVLRKAPPFPFLDKSHHGEPVLVIAAFYGGQEKEGQELLSRVKEFGELLGEGVAYHPFQKFQQAFDPLLTPGMRNYWKSHNFEEIDDALIDLLIDYANRLPSPHSEIFLAQMGGKASEIPPRETAYPHRSAQFIMNVHTRWERVEEDRQAISWARELFEKTKPYATGGVYVNFVSEGDDSLESAYGDNGEKLKKIKSLYDPNNVLRANLNVPPLG